MNIVFDFGAVLFHWSPAELLRHALPAERTRSEADVQHWVQAFFQSYAGDWGRFDRGTISPEALVDSIARRTGLSPAEVQTVVDAVPGVLTPIPESVDLLRRLHAATRASGHGLFYLSNMPAPLADHLERSHEFLGLFDAGVFSSRVQITKPAPEIYALATQRFGVPAGELVFLDDHAPNVAAARAAGWQALQFEHAAQAEAQMRARGWWPGA